MYKYINTWLKKNKYIKLKKRRNVKYIILLLILYFNIYIYISCQVYNRRVRKISVVSLPRPSLVNAASSLYLDQTGDCFFYILLAHTSDKIGIDKYLYTKEGIEKKKPWILGRIVQYASLIKKGNEKYEKTNLHACLYLLRVRICL